MEQASGHARLAQPAAALPASPAPQIKPGGPSVELGANWIEGLKGNPIYDLAQSCGLAATRQHWDRIVAYDQNGRQARGRHLHPGGGGGGGGRKQGGWAGRQAGWSAGTALAACASTPRHCLCSRLVAACLQLDDSQVPWAKFDAAKECVEKIVHSNIAGGVHVDLDVRAALRMW